ncbi:hypothetical protein ACGFYP_21365 [Streptomyces sp. NPDC048370]|uniref:hypothetical protein n=1 Tax=Streptomyces sp. NPDC048370 TaxID=3365540 RepID=UPI003715C461
MVEVGLETLHRQNTPEMTEHLGGPEPEQAIVDRHRRYLRLDGGEMLLVRLGADPVDGGCDMGTLVLGDPTLKR